MKQFILIILLMLFLTACAATTVSVYKGDPKDTKPVLVIVGVPTDGDIVYEEAADGKVTLTIKQKKEGFHPFGKLWDLAKAIAGRVLDTTQVAVGVE